MHDFVNADARTNGKIFMADFTGGVSRFIAYEKEFELFIYLSKNAFNTLTQIHFNMIYRHNDADHEMDIVLPYRGVRQLAAFGFSNHNM